MTEFTAPGGQEGRFGVRRWMLVGVALAAAGGVALLCVLAFRAGRFGVVVPGKVYHCEQPRGPQYAMLGTYGIRRVINLRLPEEEPEAFAEEQQACAARGVEFVNIPVGGELPTGQQMEQFLRAVRSSPGPVLFHCEFGRNRTIFMKALYRIVVQEWSVERAMGEVRKGETNMEGEKRARCRQVLTEVSRNRAEWLERTAPGASRWPASLPSGEQSGAD